MRPSNTWKWIVWGDTCTDKTNPFVVKGCLNRKQQAKGTQEDCSALWITNSGFMVVGLVFWVVSGQSSCSCSFFVPLRALLGGIYIVRVSGRLAEHIMSWCLFYSFCPLWIFSLVLEAACSSVFLIGISYCETTYANGYFHTWPEWVVSVNSSLITTLWETSHSRRSLGIGDEVSFSVTSSCWHRVPYSEWKMST